MKDDDLILYPSRRGRIRLTASSCDAKENQILGIREVRFGDG